MPRLTIVLFLLLAAGIARADEAGRDAETFFELKIRPVLVGTCFRCHGGDKVSHGLRVDSRAALLKGGDSGPAMIPGDPDRSLLIRALRYTDDDLRMPPNKALPAEVVADFVRWVKQGAPWPLTSKADQRFVAPRHWAFEPVKRVSPPADHTGWSENPIDRFIMGKLRQHGLRPLRPAPRAVLIRRAYFDLIGLPPAPEEVEAFTTDRSPDAFARLIDHLLASPRYGERWGRHWMDVVRYADTAGDNADYPVPEARLYRDYVIDSFNSDKPYDQFVQEQIAGDVLAKQGPRQRYAERVIATGFLALSRRYATGPYELWPLTIEDAIDTTGRAFLGLTLRCARCHDHKFDPVTTRDYYALYGTFASTQFPWAGAEELHSKKMNRMDFVPLLPPDEAAPRLAAYGDKVRQLEEEISRAPKTDPQKHARLETALRNLKKPGLPAELPGAYAVHEGKPVDVPVQIAGDDHRPGPVVKRNVPVFLADGRDLSIAEGSSGRLEVARWLTRPDHPLTARVMVNRIWQFHFGKGIVGTPSNFGTRGDEPTHPELLDWLTARFVEGGWSVKALHRLMMRSKIYQMASGDDPASAAKDPGNRWYWRFDRRRLDAEAIRDAMLQVSGNLDERRPGPHPFPPIESWSWTQHNPFRDVYASNQRSVYLMTQRFQRHPYLALFDGPDPNTSTAQRTSSTVPLQALFLMNNPFVTAQAEGLARHVLAACPDSRRRVDLACRLAWCRAALPYEQDKALRYLEEYRRQLEQAAAPAHRLEIEAWASYARVLLSSDEFVYID